MTGCRLVLPCASPLSSRCGAYFPQLEFMKHKITLATSGTIPKATVFLNGNGEGRSGRQRNRAMPAGG